MAKVLLIDSDNVRRERMVFDLQGAGHEVNGALCSISGLEFARSNPPEIILCGDSLEGLSPLDLLEMRLEVAFLSDLPIVVFGDSSRKKIDFLKAGCDDFWLMPTDAGELSLRVNALLKTSRGAGVSGSFAHISIFDLIQLFMGARQTGLLAIESAGLKSMMVVESGQITHCSIEGQDAEDGEALFVEVMRSAQRSGDFSFKKIEADDIPAEYSTSNISKRTDHLLLGIANILDEDG